MSGGCVWCALDFRVLPDAGPTGAALDNKGAGTTVIVMTRNEATARIGMAAKPSMMRLMIMQCHKKEITANGRNASQTKLASAVPATAAAQEAQPGSRTQERRLGQDK